MIYKSVSELIGNTPMVELANTMQALDLKSQIFAKLESFNPGGSVKDRAAKNIIEVAKKEGKLLPVALPSDSGP